MKVINTIILFIVVAATTLATASTAVVESNDDLEVLEECDDVRRLGGYTSDDVGRLSFHSHDRDLRSTCRCSNGLAGTRKRCGWNRWCCDCPTPMCPVAKNVRQLIDADDGRQLTFSSAPTVCKEGCKVETDSFLCKGTVAKCGASFCDDKDRRELTWTSSNSNCKCCSCNKCVCDPPPLDWCPDVDRDRLLTRQWEDKYDSKDEDDSNDEDDLCDEGCTLETKYVPCGDNSDDRGRKSTGSKDDSSKCSCNSQADIDSRGLKGYTSGGSDCPNCCKCKQCRCDSHADGDPHFTTWSNEHFDFQGECDMVLVENPSFMEGVGMTVHGRTKLHGSWSSFAAAAIKMGDDVIEIHGSNNPLINGVPFPVPAIEYGSEFLFPITMAGFSLTVQLTGPNSRRHIIHFGNGERIFINNFKEFIDIEVESPRANEFAGAVGLLGSYNTGKKMARDGMTIIEDPDMFGQEWQVRPDDAQLFSIVEGPQYPTKCNMPKKLTGAERHLRALSKQISEEDAKKACANAKPSRMLNCIADVFGADDVDMAGIYEDHH